MEGHDVARHLHIPLQEYDARIRTFVPYYEEMQDVIARAIADTAPADALVLELGIGTGALAERCREARPDVAIAGIDADPDILAMARARLGRDRAADLRAGNYLEMELPAADVIMASISLHHVSEASAKRGLYERCRRALRPGGMMLLADCYPPSHSELAASGMFAWLQHLEETYSGEDAQNYLSTWAQEDTYFPLMEELQWLHDAGFRAEVLWRRDLFAVLLCPSV